MESDRRLLGILTEAFGAHSTVFVRRHLEALAEFRPFVACLKRLNPRIFPYEPVHELRSASLPYRLGDLALRVLPRRFRYTDAVEAEPLFRRLLARYRPKALHVHFGWMAARLAHVLCSGAIPYTVVIHGSDLNLALQTPSSIYTKRLLRALSRAEKVLYVSEHLYRKGMDLGCPPDRAEVFYLGVPVGDETADTSADGPARIVCIGRFVPFKGHSWLLRSFAEVLKKHPRITLVLIGDGPLRGAMVRLADELGISGRLEFRGNMLNRDVLDELLRSHIYVQSSVLTEIGRNEGLGIAVQEAMSLGLPVVGSRCGGIPESIVHDATGLLVDDGDVAGLANALTALIENPEARRKFGAAGRERVREKFDLASRNAALVEIIRDMVDR